MRRAKLFDHRPIPLTTGDVLVRSDVFLHGLEPSMLDALGRVVEHGLTPSGLEFTLSRKVQGTLCLSEQSACLIL
jgi:hypothetical protein